MEPRISLVTLPVVDVEEARAFYTRLGFTPSAEGDATVAFFQLGGGIVLSLYAREDFARDLGLAEGELRPGAMALAHNTRSELDVDKLAAAFVAAGGRLLKAPHKVFWGGYIAYAADPDGHIWEIAFNPAWQLARDGGLILPA